MAFYCTFLYSDPSEFELLVGKIIVESSHVNEWFIVEGSYSFKGEFKGLHLKLMLESDPRLVTYLDRINLFEIRENLLVKDWKSFNTRFFLEKLGKRILKQNSAALDRARTERKFFEIEKFARDFPTKEIISRTSSDDWIFITDVDEIVNMSSEEVVRDIKLATASGADFIQLQRRRYVFDFDNLDPRFRTIPLVRISLLSNFQNLRISSFRFMNNGVIFLTSQPPVVEFSYCFSIQNIRKKLQNFSHLPPPDDAIDEALMYNHQLRYPDDLDSNICWFGKDKKIDEYLPHYFLERLSALKTNTVNEDYMEFRIKCFPDYFSFREDLQ